MESCALSNKTREIGTICPLYVYPIGADVNMEHGRIPNLAPDFISAFSSAVGLRFIPDAGDREETFGPEDVFHYVYAVLHSPEYRRRYADFLKSDYARVPLPGNRSMFAKLVRSGARLVHLHLLACAPEDMSARTTFLIGDGGNVVERVRYAGPTSETAGRVWINRTQYFDKVPPDTYHFPMGGYRPAEKWLKDRKGRSLSSQDIEHYCAMIAALDETGDRMTEIDAIIDQYGGWPAAFEPAEPETPRIVPFRPPTVAPDVAARYVTCVPLFDLKAAAGDFGDPQHVDENEDVEWVRVGSRRLRPGMFVAEVVGRSMEPAIPDGSWCLFRSPVEGTRQGKTVLVELRGDPDPDTGERYTVKRYTSEKTEGDADGDWRHTRIALRPTNPDYKPIILSAEEGDAFRVIAEFLEVVGSKP